MGASQTNLFGGCAVGGLCVVGNVHAEMQTLLSLSLTLSLSLSSRPDDSSEGRILHRDSSAALLVSTATSATALPVASPLTAPAVASTLPSSSLADGEITTSSSSSNVNILRNFYNCENEMSRPSHHPPRATAQTTATSTTVPVDKDTMIRYPKDGITNPSEVIVSSPHPHLRLMIDANSAFRKINI